ncbi:bifunctional Winged helix DNA-binding domain superfamily/Creatinase-aminopeptidase-like/Peptidase M24/Winged helix-like DNA-binding domain superfamily [Babesia duncani]|uniref:Bifunctional Winged helix DNA-binding domain superfamily/Creatinase-aminopeptidase-like/Peptidase M24/Winged helix-like DNA-binding domain superfamily n=1 Tax=Babesia duncani TaxID=323732 RepID=A0AAD9PLZ4_9APIC|nr:bifunctional Winged helix DNA-binding domain superfamily/Creatinase-aminopeptidase-like/Peptidase M24/Winged helix-like DNA-binding domain superfamily [Babesia duncani]
MATIVANATNTNPESQEKNLTHNDVLTKYRTAAKIANDTLQKLISEIKDGASVKTICDLGDQLILEETSKIYNKKENGKKVRLSLALYIIQVEKGIAYPTTVSINEICNNFSPLEDTAVIGPGDVIKINLGCHIDGYAALVAHTVYNGATVPPREAALILATHTALEAALREIKIGNSSLQVSKTIQKIASEFGVNAMIGCYSHEMHRNVLEGNNYFAATCKVEDRVEGFKFAENQVYTVNIMFTTGEGKAKSTEFKTNIYRLDAQNRYTLKTTLGRLFISKLTTQYPAFPFHVKNFSEDRSLKVGLPEALRHSLVVPYNVGTEKNGELVAHFKATVLLLAGGLKRISGIDLTQELPTEIKVTDEELLQLLATPLAAPKKKSKKEDDQKVDQQPVE